MSGFTDAVDADLSRPGATVHTVHIVLSSVLTVHSGLPTVQSPGRTVQTAPSLIDFELSKSMCCLSAKPKGARLPRGD